MLILPDLQQADLGAYPHRPLMTDRDVAPVARLWLLADDATPAVVPPVLMAEAAQQQTFSLANIVPQAAELNRGVWARFEMAVRRWSAWADKIADDCFPVV